MYNIFSYNHDDVYINTKVYNKKNNSCFLYTEYFSWILKISNNITMVEKNKKYNFINNNNKFIFDVWFDGINLQHNKLISVSLNNKWNLVDFNGNILFSIWYDRLLWFNNYFYIVYLNKKYNIINILTKKYISNMWFDKYTVNVMGNYGIRKDSIIVWFNDNKHDKYILNVNGCFAHFLDG